MTRSILALFAFLLCLPAFAQDTDTTAEEERSLFTSFLEDQLSTPNRQIRISGIQGALSSEAIIAEITIADREGVWLRISNAVIDWSRSTLLLRQRLEIQHLGAESIQVIRRPLPSEGLPSPEARSFTVPELPIAINLESLQVPQVSFGEEVFGLESMLSIEGRLRLESGSLDTAMEIERLDGPGGQLSLQAEYSNESEEMDVDLALSEPENGVLANVLNIEGHPPLSLTLNGSGPIDQLDLALALTVADQPAVTGTARFRQTSDGLGFRADIEGSVERLLPSTLRGFFGDQTTLQASGVAKNSGGMRLDELTLTSASLQLEATADTASDGFPTSFSLNASIADPDGERVVLPVRGGTTAVQSAHLTVDYGDASGEWEANLDVTDLQTDTITADKATLVLTGEASNLAQPDARSLTFDAEGGLDGIIAVRADIADALGSSILLQASGSWSAGEPLTIASAELAGHALTVSLDGTVSDLAFQGDISIETESIAPFSGLAERELEGGLNLSANGAVRPISGAFDLTLDGTADSLRIGIPTADALLVGETQIGGRLARGEQGLSADDFRIANEQVELTANGAIASDNANFRFDAALSDLALVTDRAQGRLTVNGSATGTDGILDLTFAAEVPDGRLLDRSLSAASLRFDGTLQNRILAGDLNGNALLDGVNAQLQANVSAAEDRRQLNDLTFSTEGARLTGDLMQDGDGLLTGDLVLNATDISTAAALFLEEAEGAVDAELSLQPRNDEQHVALAANLRNVVSERFSVNAADIQADIDNLFGVPEIEGTIDANGLSAAGIDVAEMNATAETRGQTTEFSANAVLTNGTDISASGSLTPQDGGYTISLEQAELEQQGASASLARPVSLSVQGRTIRFDPVELDVAGGQITAQGEISATYDVAVTINSVPLSLANTVRPDLEMGGTISGNATISGPRSQPQVNFDLTGRAITADVLAQAGLQSLDIDANGNTVGQTLNVNARATSPGGLNVVIEGAVPLDNGNMALDITLQAFPISLLNARIPGQDLGGTLTGSARVVGTLDNPAANFTLQAENFTAAPLATFGATPLAISASGRYAEGAVALESLSASGPAGLSVSASGRVPLTGSGLAVNASGTVPLPLANRLLAERGAQLTGTITADLNVAGSLANPVITGSFSTANAAAVDPMTNMRLTNIQLVAALQQETLTISSASAAFAAGGTVSIAGSISTNAAAGFPANLTINLNQARYVDQDLVTATLNGSMSLQGPLTRDPLLSGNLTVDNAEIAVPEHFGGGAAELEVEHIAPPPAVQQTLRRARADDGTPMPSDRPSVLRLNLNINAPARIFVRGRGLDAELGGSIQLTGPITSVQPVGGFRLIRGRFDILTQRLTFDEGTVTLLGDLDPVLNFVARSAGTDITVFVTVSGPVSDLDITFSSQPELPEDEVLARLIFNRGIDELSPLQLAQLAAAAAELAGGGGNSLLGALREATGLEDIDIITDAEGNPALRVGNYIQENVYVGVETGTGGTTRATINLDITEDLRARGSVGSDGDSSLGIFYERDY
ncbi:translocation/assembly module TamB domain-containing protein [Chelativorans sp. YIM 93263]|uniref:translocation/assembly module TamB domain-containing protein n=1 Tax=Chelativorans sp. YIM 93263 TaxID=2906648 RepID=UPI0023783677|nr:translocation/assembly module TamB domain-containing protein [Chelativorans sp. YIM 93263]